MKVCHRCGERTSWSDEHGESYFVTIAVHEAGSEMGICTFKQGFVFCSDCVRRMFDELCEFVRFPVDQISDAENQMSN